jgi:RNA polymerase sigma-70 factor (ECF subfamily)
MTPNEQIVLAQGLKVGSEKAKQILFVRCYDSFVEAAEKLVKNREDAEDVVSEAMDKMFSRADQIKEESKLLGWCYRIIRNKAFDYIKGRVVTDSLDVHEPTSRVPFTCQADLELISKVIDTLPPGYKEVLKLHCYEGKSYEEIQDRLQISPGTVKSQIWKGRRLLRKKLNFEY